MENKIGYFNVLVHPFWCISTDECNDYSQRYYDKLDSVTDNDFTLVLLPTFLKKHKQWILEKKWDILKEYRNKHEELEEDPRGVLYLQNTIQYANYSLCSFWRRYRRIKRFKSKHKNFTKKNLGRWKTRAWKEKSGLVKHIVEISEMEEVHIFIGNKMNNKSARKHIETMREKYKDDKKILMVDASHLNTASTITLKVLEDMGFEENDQIHIFGEYRNQCIKRIEDDLLETEHKDRVKVIDDLCTFSLAKHNRCWDTADKKHEMENHLELYNKEANYLYIEKDGKDD